jgi:hypothetical protein
MAKQIPLGHGLFALIDDEDYALLSQYNWFVINNNGKLYAYRLQYVDGKRTKVYMHKAILPPIDARILDHINGNGLDNRRANLRHASVSQNAQNQGKQTRNGLAASQYKGVMRHHTGKWRVAIKAKERRIHLGVFADEKDAARAYNDAAIKYFGEFARLNEVE